MMKFIFKITKSAAKLSYYTDLTNEKKGIF